VNFVAQTPRFSIHVDVGMQVKVDDAIINNNIVNVKLIIYLLLFGLKLLPYLLLIILRRKTYDELRDGSRFRLQSENPDPNTYIYKVKSMISRIVFNFSKCVESTSLVHIIFYMFDRN
jgi:hypothetical protein